MCGITGFLETTNANGPETMREFVSRMTETLIHRGPDDSGIWCDPQAGVALGFRRLAILDLSPAGHQPMASADGRYVIIFNGEVYNFAEMRAELAGLGHAFQGHSDTEVLLAAICEWDLEPAVRRFNGMFAIALWDKSQRCLHLIRDRVGVKPLYYGWAGTTFLFGSELKALRAHPAFHPEIDRDALALYLRYNYIPTPFSIYRGIHKLAPGCILSIRTDSPAHALTPAPYWSAKEAVERNWAQPFHGDDAEAIKALDALLRRSLGQRMVADVPLGAFLSGGVDSSAIVALMQAQSSRPIKTFTIGFREADFNEAGYARTVARHLGTDHTELQLISEETRNVIPLLPSLYDEPFADSSQIPTFLVSKLARQDVTVCLSGDGGDELFGGYRHYAWMPAAWKLVQPLPIGLRRLSANAIQAVPSSIWTDVFQIAHRLTPGTNLFANPELKIRRLADVLNAENSAQIFFDFVSHWKQPTDIIPRAHEPVSLMTNPARWAQVGSAAEWMMFLDLVTYLPDDILTKVDRASMGVSLEVRTPYLDDHEVVEFAWGLPLRMKIRRGTGKSILRKVLYQYVPKEMIERPKMGFSIPIDSWMRGPIKEWAESLLDEKRLQEEGFFNPEPIRKKWAEHLSGAHNWQYSLWGILMFQAWREANY
jgi:asparagine synthase (glutamine-hydrolysing)